MRIDLPKSTVPGLLWPALPGGQAATMLALQHQLAASEWWPPDVLRAQQLRQLHGLLVHCMEQVPFYRQRLAAAGFRPDKPLTEEIWQRIPLLERADVQRSGEALRARSMPSGHGSLGSSTSSGSTGRPVTVVSSGLAGFFWHAGTLRHVYWHRPDLSGKLAIVRASDDPEAVRPEGKPLPQWGQSTALVYRTGPATLMSVNAPDEQKLDWLLREDPDYLLSYPSSLAGVLELARRRGARPARLRSVETVGGLVSPALRALCREVWGVTIRDGYSAQEIGYLALQCPEQELYHLQSEFHLVEVIDEAGAPCPPGGLGRVVVTPLHNFAMPLLRYVLGDFAEPGEPCSCGRGLPVLRRILGRNRNLLTLPDGRRVGPRLNETRYRDVAPVSQFQIVQKSLERIEVRLAVERPLTGREEARLGDLVREGVGSHFSLSFVYLDEIPREPGGKYEDFKSEM